MRVVKFSSWTRTLMLVVVVIAIIPAINLNAADELVGLWNFDDGSGSSACDDSVNSNDGTVYGAAWTSGIDGGALSFDGTDDYVDCGNDSMYNFNDTNAFTISFWINPDSLAYQGIIGKWDGNWYDSPFQIIMDYNEKMRICIGSGSNYGNVYIPSGSFSTGSWYHVVTTYDGSTLRAYLNGEEKDSEQFDYTLTSNSSSIEIGRYGNATKFCFDGIIDAVRMYNYDLTVMEIQELYKPAGLCANWDFNDGSGSTASDQSVYDNDGTLYGTPTWSVGIEGDAVSFDGSDDYVDCGNSSMYNFNDTNAFTISFWMKPDSLEYQGIIGKWDDNWYDSPFQIIMDYNEKMRISIGTGTTCGNIYIPASSLSTGNWYYIVATYDGSTLRAYLNGEEKVSETFDYTLTSNSSSIEIGRYGNATKYYFDGVIDEVRLYNYNLDAVEVNDIYMSTSIRGNWDFNDGIGSTAEDSSDNDNHGTIYGASWVTGHPDADGYFHNALSFDGIDDYVDCSNDSTYNFADTNAFTISFWIKPDSLAYQGIIGKWDGNWYDSPFQIIMDYEQKMRISIGSGSNYGNVYIPAGSFSTGSWYYVVATYDGSILRAYLNGEEEDSEQFDYTLTSNSSSIEIGRYGNATKFCFDGVIDKVKIYSRAIDQATIDALYNNLISAYASQTYYTTEAATIICSVDMAPTELDDCYLAAKNSSGTTLDTNNTPETDPELSMANASLSSGTNVITVELYTDAGALLYSCDIDVVKRASSSGFETKIDRENGIILRDGDAFFPIGFYMYGIETDDTAAFADVADGGFNTVLRWQTYGIAATDATTYLENADAEGLLVMDKLCAYSSVNLTGYKSDADDFWNAYVDERDDMIDAVGYAKQESNLLAYYTFDEPLPSQFAAGRDLYARTNTEDGYHPTFAMYCDYPVDENYTNWSDILAMDPYWIAPYVSGDVYKSINYVTKYAYLTSKRAREDHKACCMVLMSEYFSKSRKRSITTAEQRCQTYLALIHGAKGLIYFRYPVYHDSMYSEISNLTTEIDDLSPALLNNELDQEITYFDNAVEVSFNPVPNDFVDVQVRLFEAPASASYDYVLLAANTTECTVNVDYTVSLLGSSGTVSRLFDTNTYAVSNSEFSDTLAAYGTRAYTFSSSSTASVTIAVDSDPGTAPAAETLHSTDGRSGCTNLMQNPTLEDAVIASWPDYIFPWYANPRINTASQQWGLQAIADSTGLPTGHGSNCLKIADGDGETYGDINGCYFYLTPQHTDSAGKDYTFSVYMKADTAGEEVYLGSSLGRSAKKTLTTSWARYSYTINVPASWNANNLFYIQLWDTGTIYVDAIQVEQASSATSFTTN